MCCCCVIIQINMNDLVIKLLCPVMMVLVLVAARSGLIDTAWASWFCQLGEILMHRQIHSSWSRR